MIGNILLDNNLFIGFGNDDFTSAELTIQIPCDLTTFVLVDGMSGSTYVYLN